MPCIYKITNKISGRLYVGQAKNPDKRWKSHIQCANSGIKTKLYCAMRGYGVKNFEMTILEECRIEEMNKKESEWIQKLDSLNQGYNMIADCSHGRIISDETRQRMSNAQIGKKLTDEHKKAISKGGKGRKISPLAIEKTRQKLTGQKRTLEQIERMKVAASNRNHEHLVILGRNSKGRIVPDYMRQAVSAAHKGKPKSPEQRQKMSAAAKNASPEVRAKRADAIRAAYARKRELRAAA